ncbi:hypothetical protein V1512DRAFT_267918 [Lipomyces arxii]|uniref:uncharacterized protein n=1 Tax=Lipomyces arxii TaxID=56418 RepID=UPI0034CD3045
MKCVVASSSFFATFSLSTLLCWCKSGWDTLTLLPLLFYFELCLFQQISQYLVTHVYFPNHQQHIQLIKAVQAVVLLVLKLYLLLC